MCVCPGLVQSGLGQTDPLPTGVSLSGCGFISTSQRPSILQASTGLAENQGYSTNNPQTHFMIHK